MKFDKTLLKPWDSVKFGQQAPGYTSLQGKNELPAKGNQKFEFQSKGKLDWFHDNLNPKLYF
jgi:hypothetical protein